MYSKERDIITSHNTSLSLYIMINLKQNGNYSEAKYQFSSSLKQTKNGCKLAVM